MFTGLDDGEAAADLPLRERQEREIALGHSLSRAEHQLAREASAVCRVFELAGLEFDPLTFVALRIIEGSADERVDPVECLQVLHRLGFFDRSVEMLEDAA